MSALLVSRETSLLPAGLEPLNVSRETTTRLAHYVALLLRWNRTINLISRRDEQQIWDRHIADSVQLVPLIPQGVGPSEGHAIDLGSGAGFPGVVLALATGVHVHLVEADVRKAAFLREAARETGASVSVHACRIEAAALAPALLVTARALAPLPKLIDLAAPLLLPGGVCLFPKGREAEGELTAAALRWKMRVERFPSLVDRSGLILRISEVAGV